jgi:anthranilate/para-aminobenzoate synthase component I
MPMREVGPAAPPAALLQCSTRAAHAVLLDGGGADSWGCGEALYCDAPVATLEVFPSGWGRWWTTGVTTWRWADPLAQWQEFLSIGQSAPGADAGGGCLSVLSYELKHWIERLPRRLPWPQLPVLYCARYDWAYRVDYRSGRAAISAASQERSNERLRWYERVRPDLHAGAAGPAPARRAARCLRPAMSRTAYREMLRRAHEYIAAGDAYEINLAQSFSGDADLADAAPLFAAWTQRYPMPFAAFVDGGAWAIVSNSPECFLQRDGERVATFPIKGTRRLENGDLAAHAAALRADPKERAEHVMVVDLERNDLGRVCMPGSVEVADLAAVRQYPMLVHMVSEVRGRLRPGIPAADVLRATFPGGSITGAPKIRAMQIIEELEPSPRGFYTGAIGWTEPDGRSRFSIAIRTAVLHGGSLTYWAGGGIVADSDAEREYDETLVKSETLFRAWGALQGRSA